MLEVGEVCAGGGGGEGADGADLGAEFGAGGAEEVGFLVVGGEWLANAMTRGKSGAGVGEGFYHFSISLADESVSG